MTPNDFLKREAETPLQECFMVGEAVCELSTNCETILEAARETFVPIATPVAGRNFRLRFWVDEGLASGPPWPKPYVRGLGNLIFAGLDSQNSLLVDRRALRAIGRFSPAMGADQTYWKMAVLPLIISIFGGSIGSTELHCGCTALNGRGLLLAGHSGSGKSTLSWALAHMGFSFLSDDRTHFSRRGGDLLAWSVNRHLKLRPESMTLFPELNRLVPKTFPDGERACHFDPECDFGVSRLRSCKPRWLIFLERRRGVAFRLTPMTPAKAAKALSFDVLAEEPEISKMHFETITQLVRHGGWQLAYDGNPAAVARSLARFCEDSMDMRTR